GSCGISPSGERGTSALSRFVQQSPITSKDLNLTKAHVRYLESRLIVLLREAKKCSLQNKTEPVFERLPEADISDMETFLEEIQLLLPVIGIDFLRRPQMAVAQQSKESSSQTVTFFLTNANKGISARAVEAEGEFIVLTGSTGSLNVSPSFHERIRLVREQALESGRAVRTDDHNFRLVEDLAFSSPSAAAVFLFGTSRNGRTDWLVSGSSETYSTFKERQL
ncbi:DUF4357 domain-containing protein, partial [Paracoccus simplex]